tara:strand:+ start:201 stop:449 length:249 start_codon:yes stop_codon:yes gene_type:complete
MKYKNATNNPIFIKLDGNRVVVAPGEEVSSLESLGSFGLVAFPTEKPEAAPPVKVAPKKEKSTSNPKSVNTNEFSTTDTTKN